MKTNKLFNLLKFSLVLASQVESAITKVGDSFHDRRSTLTRRDDIDFQKLPQCARPYCNASEALSPSRLGCIEANLTKKCLCETAVAPLACVPSGPSSDDNCWYNTEDWLAGQCDGKVPLVPRTSMPSCIQDCAVNWLRKKGCRTDTRNCFCKLDGKEIVGAVEQCKKDGCMKHMRPEFEVSFWREQVCAQGGIDTYDEGAYRARKKQVRDIRIGVPVVLGIMCLVILTVGIAWANSRGNSYPRQMERARGEQVRIICITLVIVAFLILCIIPPIFVAI